MADRAYGFYELYPIHDALDYINGREPLPDWTLPYPEAARPFIAERGADPQVYPRGHELNMRLAELVAFYEKAAPGWQRSHAMREMFARDASRIAWRVGVDVIRQSDEETLRRFEGRETPLPPARPSEEIEPGARWFEAYPVEYQEAMKNDGVPTVPGTLVDELNWRTIERLRPFSENPAEVSEAQYEALNDAFKLMAHGDEEDDRRITMEIESTDEDAPDLPDVAWSYYPEDVRGLLNWVGRPDYEHPFAWAYNRALIGAARFCRSRGEDEDRFLAELRPHLWTEFFGDVPRPMTAIGPALTAAAPPTTPGVAGDAPVDDPPRPAAGGGRTRKTKRVGRQQREHATLDNWLDGGAQVDADETIANEND